MSVRYRRDSPPPYRRCSQRLAWQREPACPPWRWQTLAESLAFDAERGDEVQATWPEDGETRSRTFVPSEVSDTELKFGTTDAFNDMQSGDMITFAVKIAGRTLVKETENLGAGWW